jgi:hypothetical protein
LIGRAVWRWSVYRVGGAAGNGVHTRIMDNDDTSCKGKSQ